MIHQHNWKNKVQIDSPNWTHLISVFPFPQMFLKASFKSWSVHITSASQQTCKDFIRQEVKSSCCLFWKSEKSIAILQNSWFFPFYSSSLIWETRDKIFILTNKKKKEGKTRSLLVKSLQSCSPHFCWALPATIQVNSDERDGLIAVLVTLLVDNKEVLLVFCRVPAQRRHSRVTAWPCPYLEGFILPSFAIRQRPAHRQVNSCGGRAKCKETTT